MRSLKLRKGNLLSTNKRSYTDKARTSTTNFCTKACLYNKPSLPGALQMYSQYLLWQQRLCRLSFSRCVTQSSPQRLSTQRALSQRGVLEALDGWKCKNWSTFWMTILQDTKTHLLDAKSKCCLRSFVPALDNDSQNSPFPRRHAQAKRALQHTRFVPSFPNAGKPFAENNTNSTECAINQHNHGITSLSGEVCQITL